MDQLSQDHQKIEQNIFNYGLTLLRPWYAKRQEFAKTIPKFWPTAIDKSELFGEYISYEDNEIIDHLTDLNIEWSDESPKKYTITMTFDENKYTEACTLAKEFDTQTQTSKAVSVPWKQGMDLTIDKDGRDSSFFKWFGETKEAAFEIGSALSEDFYPHALEFYNFEGGDEEWSLSESEGEEEEESERSTKKARVE